MCPLSVFSRINISNITLGLTIYTFVVYLVVNSCFFVNVEFFHCIKHFIFTRSVYYVHDVFYGFDKVLIV